MSRPSFAQINLTPLLATLIIIFSCIGLVAILKLQTTNQLSNQDLSPNPEDNKVESTPISTPRMSVDKTINLIAVGDVMLGRSVNTRMLKYNNWNYPFLETADWLKQADIAFGNLESPFGETCPPTDEGFIFCADQRSLEGLLYAGFDVLSLANNHNTNQGQSGLELTETLLESNNIIALQEAEIEYQQIENITLAFLAFDDTKSPIDQTLLRQLIAEAKTNADIVVVSFHWGWEYVDQPNQNQIDLAHKSVDAGADLIIGHHPHWVQTIEEYGDGLIFYSLGNFVFDQMWSIETRTGMVANIILDKSGVVDYSTRTVLIEDYSQPKFVD